MANNKVITVTDMESILNNMNLYKKQNGFIAFVGDKLTLFDSEPSFGAAYITKNQVLRFINSNK